jgi:hypothetical protein
MKKVSRSQPISEFELMSADEYDKRCPHATNHENACTGSNEVGQKGSSWESVKAPVTKPRSIPYEQRHCQNGHEACLAGRRDGVVCPDDSCDIDDGVRKA